MVLSNRLITIDIETRASQTLTSDYSYFEYLCSDGADVACIAASAVELPTVLRFEDQAATVVSCSAMTGIDSAAISLPQRGRRLSQAAEQRGVARGLMMLED